MAGVLYLVATPIGNLEDMTFRAVRILNEVDIIAAEDTRNSIKLLNHFEIKKPMTSYHEFNRYDKADVLIGDMLDGKSVAVITDAGTPGISDPGEVLVEKCYENGITVIPVPGACAAVNALVASGQPARQFVFEAFLPQDKKERKEALERLSDETRTMIIYEAPHRLKKTLDELIKVFGGARDLTVCKELTKKHENFMKTTLDQALEYFSENEPKGEYVLVIKGRDVQDLIEREQAKYESLTIEEHVKLRMEEGLSKKDAIKKVAEERGLPKREVYAAALDL